MMVLMNRAGICFYEEKAKPHDLLFVWESPRTDVKSQWNGDGVATVISGVPLSVNWTKISDDYLHRRCRRLNRDEVESRILIEPNWQILLDRADWMTKEMAEKDEAVLPF